MKRLKTKLFSLLLIFTIFSSLTVNAVVDKPDVYIGLQIGQSQIIINGNTSEIDPGRDTKPVICNGRTLVPIRAIAEAIGGAVSWDEKSQAVTIALDTDRVRLVIGSQTAYFNNTPSTLDTAPAIINGRTMLPIRFIAESFNLGVAWDESAQKVYIVRNSFDTREYNYLKAIIPEYNGNPYVEVNNNIPFFKDYEIIPASFEYYSTPDDLNRCDVCLSSVSTDTMPTTARGSISQVTPTGWLNKKYDHIDGSYLYNRCHLIGHQLTGENANEKNLITGTRYLNIEGMLPFENMIDDYIEENKGHVLYRVTPVFDKDNLVASGVLLEAHSVEDNGKGISFCVYCYNVQPGVVINYSTGESHSVTEIDKSQGGEIISTVYYRTPGGKRYHTDLECGGKNSYEITLEEAIKDSLTPCSKCAE